MGPSLRTNDVDHVIAGVGARLRALRHQRTMTLADLSEATGISVSTLSRLESSQRRPTLEQLLPLARAFGVQLDEMVGAPATGDPRITLRPTVRHGRTFIPLTRRPGGVQAYKVVIPVARHDDRVVTATHEGYEWLYVLDGRVRLVLGGGGDDGTSTGSGVDDGGQNTGQDLELGPGEAAEFDTRVPHWIGATLDGPTEVLMLFGPQGERAHVRARTR